MWPKIVVHKMGQSGIYYAIGVTHAMPKTIEASLQLL
jgi:hypothetical protein